MRKKQNRLKFNPDIWAAFIFMHIIFFLVQLFFFYIYFEPTPFTEWNIPVIYFRIQEIGYPIVLACSLVWLNRTFFPGETRHILISIAIFMIEWFGVDKWILH